MATWQFVAVKAEQDVTNTLSQKKASKARVAFVGKEAGPTVNKGFQVWYRPSDDDHEWQLTEVAIDLASDNDADQIAKVLKGASQSTVTFAGQKDKYYVWWLD